MKNGNIFRIGTRIQKIFDKGSRNGKLNLKSNLSPVKTLYLWEKQSLKKIELFSME